MVPRFFRKLERFEYYNPRSFWSIALGFYFIFNLFTGQFVSSSTPTINSQFIQPSQICRGGDFGSNPLPSGSRDTPPIGDRGPDREFTVTPRHGSMGDSGNGGSSGASSTT